MKKLLSILIAFMMVLAVATPVFADTKVSTKEQLTAAINDSSVSEITLEADIDIGDSKFQLERALVLNLGTYKISAKISTAPGSAYSMFDVKETGDLTINATTGGLYALFEVACPGAANTIHNQGKLTINGGVISNVYTGSGNQIGYAIDNNSTVGNALLTINGGEIVASGSGWYDGIRQFCNSTTNTNTVIINDGKVSSLWTQNPSDGSSAKNTKDVKGSFTINGGEIGVVSYEPSTGFELEITNGNIGELSQFQFDASYEDRFPTGFVSGGTFDSIGNPNMVAPGYEASAEGGKLVVKEPKPTPVCAGEKDLNCDGVVTCDEGVGPGWDWNEEKGVCEFKGLPTTGEFVVVNTAVK